MLAWSCGNDNTTDDKIIEPSSLIVEDAPFEEDLFPEITAFYRQHDPGLDSAGYYFAEEQTADFSSPVPLSRKELQAFLPLLVYNEDSSKAIDMYSGSYVAITKKGKSSFESGEPDTEVAVIDFHKNERKRIFFTGPSYTVLDVRWLNDSVVAVAGAEQVDADQVLPQFNKIYLNREFQVVFQFTDTVLANPAKYMEQKLNAMQQKAGSRRNR